MNEELLSYIKFKLAKGYSRKEIKRILLANGQVETIVDQAFLELAGFEKQENFPAISSKTIQDFDYSTVLKYEGKQLSSEEKFYAYLNTKKWYIVYPVAFLLFFLFGLYVYYGNDGQNAKYFKEIIEIFTK